jgi:hypothetical protein
MPGLELVSRSKFSKSQRSAGACVSGAFASPHTRGFRELRKGGEGDKFPDRWGSGIAARPSWDKRAAPFPSPQISL